jgi:hypothetical protein
MQAQFQLIDLSIFFRSITLDLEQKQVRHLKEHKIMV